MITAKTVLVLGAGASVPFGFPTGKELVDDIISNLENPPPYGWHYFLSEIDITDGLLINNFTSRLKRANISSIDRFISLNPEFQFIGKACIAISLMLREKEEMLFNRKNKDDWYFYLYNNLIPPSLDDFKKNEIAIITFNYDRSIDHYLHTSIKNTFGIDDQHAGRILSLIPIYHVFGKLSSLPWQGAFPRTYNNNIDRPTLSSAMNTILTMSEANESDYLKLLHNYLISAERIYFIGCGYHEENMELLDFHIIKELQIPKKTITGTSVGIGTARKLELRSNWKIKFPKKICTSITSFLEECGSFAKSIPFSLQ